ncbi:hypothetical protein N7509_012924 [Penicillium cosmopolitanum]|uniref:ADP-ribosylhydrolase ARH3 n=1 Tax=Penicillium cosmopolitanum TaxID=1131564 RepID=A0A9W9SCC8_9EURO|nr:uncharacterized protein N7509_012924 [Penicillium cosmopolitanum]KAJ5376038.1 hypothetical protein N7509_012924 [Penicillium cosmopolitanum]
MELSLKSRALGAIWGTCVADALGGPVQFKEKGSFKLISDLEYVYPFDQPAGSYSDDGAMTLALAQSIIDSNGKYDHELSIKYYIQWMRKGRFSTTDYAWDMGISTREAIGTWKDSSEDTAKTQRKVNDLLDRDDKSGNGSLMRIAPIGVALWKDSKFARKVARAQSQITHPAIACLEACDAFTEVICRAMRGQSKEQLCEAFASFKFSSALRVRMIPYKRLADWRAKESGDIKSSGWVVDTLEVALWGFFKFNSWEKGALAVVNLGGDSDTAGAIYGALAGVFYGVDAIPRRWADGMQNSGQIFDIGRRFADLVVLEAVKESQS